MNFESPIEEEMARILEKFLNPEISFESQTEVQTICGLFRMDFVLSDGKFRVGLECDGREFHKERHHLDEWRDAAILGDGFVDEIVRIPGKAIFYNPNACAYFLSKWYPRFFTERSLQVLKSMIRKELEDGDLIDRDEMDAVVYFNDGDGNRITDLCFIRRFYRVPPPGRDEFLHVLYNFAVKKGGGSPDELHKKWLQRNAYIDQ